MEQPKKTEPSTNNGQTPKEFMPDWLDPTEFPDVVWEEPNGDGITIGIDNPVTRKGKRKK